VVNLTVLYTDDEHGWMAGEEEGQGAAELLSLLQERHQYGQQDGVILISGGDNWTGPAISTWFQGQGMVEVMNAMGYSASAIGNHEFDFGPEVMQARFAEANFPFLAANLRYAADNTVPTDLGILPYTIIEANGLQVGILGLSYTGTPSVTTPEYVAPFVFTDYAEAVREFAPQMRAEGADVIILTTHLCSVDLADLAREVKDLGIPFIGGGHCHNTFITRSGDTVIAIGGANLASYAYVNLAYDPATGVTSVLDYKAGDYESDTADPTVAAIVAGWQAKTDAELDVVIGYLENEVAQRSPEMQALITEAWLWANPAAHVALTNLGGMRESLPAGEVTLADVVGVMPFDNTIVQVSLTGEELGEVLDYGTGYLAVGGLHTELGSWVLNSTGEPLEDDQTYLVLVNSFMYSGGDGYEMLANYDPNAYQTSTDWRQPVFDWISAQGSSEANPLDDLIADLIQ
jgi:2',3'-cyclic-nucleotide 2'-phosphodiesterase (5'-nucleotidase family)